MVVVVVVMGITMARVVVVRTIMMTVTTIGTGVSDQRRPVIVLPSRGR